MCRAFFGAQKVVRHLGVVSRREKTSPVIGTVRKDHITRDWVFADKDFFSVKSVGRWQANGLAATVLEKFGGLGTCLISMVQW